MKYDIVSHEGEQVSVTVFVKGESYIATKEHPNFGRILDKLTQSNPEWLNPVGEKNLVNLFDVSQAVADKFEPLGERVSVAHGLIYMDGDEVNDALTQQIVRFYAEGNDNFKPLVAFMEKVATNPNEHSKQHLYRWLSKHDFAIAPDGDFWAYKGVNRTLERDELRSVSSGEAFVNGVRYNGQIPNVPGSVIEMPRSKVQFDPRQGCSTGLHAGNWRYASTFASIVVRVKINPRDVVSVPTDSHDEKLRVCRYRVDAIVSARDETALYVGDPERTAKVVAPAAEAPAKPKSRISTAKVVAPAAGKPKPKPEVKFPTHYEDFSRKHFEACVLDELRWLAKEWGVKVTKTTTGATVSKADYVAALHKDAVAQRRANKRTS